MEKLDKKKIEDIFALTPMQEGMLYHYLKNPHSDLYFEQLCLQISGSIDEDYFEEAWNFVVSNNPMLRTVFRWQKVEKPVQVVLKEHRPEIRCFDYLSDPRHPVPAVLPRSGLEGAPAGCFDLEQVPFRVTLCRIEAEKYEIIISNHHILYDGWSNGIILREFFATYEVLAAGQEPQKPIKTNFKEYIKWIKKLDQNDRENFWKEYLAGFNASTVLSVKRPGSREISAIGHFKTGLAKEFREKLEDFAKENKVTPASLFYSAYGILLQGYNNSADVIFGVTAAGRSARIKGIEDIVGLFINTLPLRIENESGEKIAGLLKRVNEALQKRQEYEATPLVDIKAYSPLAGIEELFDSIVVVENYPLDAAALQSSRLRIESYSMFEMTNYDLTLAITLSEKIEIAFIYNSELFEKGVIERLSRHFTNILEGILLDPGRECSALDILSTGERRRLLIDFNDTAADYPKDKTIHALFEEQAGITPANTALTGVEAGKGNRESQIAGMALTYKKLDEEAGILAAVLVEKGVQTGTIVGLMVERSVLMIVGILGILKAGGAYLPIDPAYPRERKRYILEDSSTPLLLSSGSLREASAELDDWQGETVFIDSPAEAEVKEAKIPSPVFNSSHLAYVIYTSGSTGKPKGVLVEHRPVVNILTALQKEYPLLEADTYLLKTSFLFDVSVAELFGWFFSGGRLAILEPGGEKDPRKIIAAIERYAVTHINFVPSMFNVFIDGLDPGAVKSLSSLRYLFLAGEALLSEPVHKARSLIPGIRLENIYGPSEGTVYSSNYSLSGWPGQGSIPIGKPMRNIKLYILNKNHELQPLGVPGELCIGGDNLARGYLNNPELSAEMFLTAPAFSLHPQTAHLSPITSHSSPTTLYRTGDIARWQPDGNIEFLGRMDFQVKIRGFRIELGEIENLLLKHKDIKEAVVTINSEKSDDKYLCAYVVARVGEESPPAPGLREYLSGLLPAYMVPAYFVHMESLPLSPTGKVIRKALPKPGIGSLEKYTAPRDGREEKLVEIWSRVLNTGGDSIGIDDNFFEIGGHSLRATRLVTKIHKNFDISVQLGEFFKAPTIRWLSAYIEEAAVKERFRSIKAVEKREYYPASPAQKRFFFFQQLEPGNVSYGMLEIMIADGRIEKEKFAAAFKKLIQRHESLRTSFKVVDAEVVQEVRRARDIKFEIEFHDLTSIMDISFTPGKGDETAAPSIYEREPAAGIAKSFVRPFDLSKAPLLRFGMIKTRAGETPSHILMVDTHHIISDGVSTGIFIADFLSFYREEDPPPLRFRYRDYVQWLLDRRQGEEEKESIDRDIEEELLELPTDYTRPAVQGFAGAVVRFPLDKEVKEALNRLALKEDSTLFMVLFAIFNIFLSKLSGQENIILGSPIAGRLHDDLEGIVGLFINTLAIRNYPAPGKSFPQFLKEVKENSLRAFDSQEHQYEELIEKVAQARSSGRNPLFDVMFVLQNMEMPELKIPGLRITRNVQKEISSKFDMTLYCFEEGEEPEFVLEYCTKLFKPGTIKRFIKYFEKVVSVVLADPGGKLGEIEFISAEEKREILYDFNDTEVEYPRHKTIYRMFEEQVERTPDDTAIWGSLAAEEETADRETGFERAGAAAAQSQSLNREQAGRGILTYAELNERANRLSRLLRAKGVKANSVVGIMLERSIELVAAIYAVLKAGGAYLPIDPEYPEKRILTMLEQGKAVTLLTRKEPVEKKEIGDIACPVLNLDDLAAEIAALPGENLPPLSGPEDLIYIIFTSGSTGVPKGAGVYQRSFVNLVNWFVKDFDLKATDRNLLMTSFSFDLTQKNFYASLILGGVLCIPAVNYFDPGAILRDIEERGVTWINCTPSMFFQLIEFCKGDELKKLSALRYVYLGGEPLSMSMFMKWVESEYCNGVIVNTYGPTECTDISNAYRITEPRRFLEEAVPIGEPVYNVKLYVTDKNLQLLPPGIAGELLIGGESVGIGYVNDKELTKKKFVSHSFGEGEPATLYRTGDLVKWLAGGRIEFIGRIDFQVKIRGFRIEIGEIESRLLDHEKIKEIIVIDRDDGSGGKYLCAYFVSESLDGELSPAAAELKEYLSSSLPDYMIPSYFVELAEMPLNPNGKVNRKALPMPDTASTREYTAPRNKLEDMLVDIWSKILGTDRGRIGIDDNFFELGGHSLKATELAARIHQQLDVDIPLREIFKIATIRGLSVYIGREEKSKYESIEPVEQKAYYPVSSAQKRLYLLGQMDLESTGYNIPSIFMLAGNVDKDRLQATFVKLIERHESLRTSFHLIAGEPVQAIHSPAEIDFEIAYLEGAAPEAHDFIRPFDLSQAPLLRVGLIKEGEANHILQLDMHHIISDGISAGLFVQDFMSLYNGEELPLLKIQYKDFSEWQNKRKDSEILQKQEAYWLEEFAAEIPVLNLPTDFPRPVVQSFAGKSLTFEMGREETEKLKTLALATGSTLYMVLLSLYNILLSKLSGQEDIVVGSPVSGRTHGDLEQVIGIFINTLALRNYPAGEKSYREFLEELGKRTLAAFDNQEYQFEDLVEKAAVERDAGRNPLFDVLFVLQNMAAAAVEIPGLKLTPYEYEKTTSKFDLTFNVVELAAAERGLHFTVTYCSDLFKAGTIKRFIGYFRAITAAVSAHPEKQLKEIDMLSSEERKRLLLEFNDTKVNYSQDKTVHRLFEEQAERRPDNIALIGESSERRKESSTLTLRELNEKANRLGRFLRARGTAPDTITGILTGPVIEMITCILAVLKAGGAYLPLDPKHPADRLTYMLNDSAAKLLLSRESLAEPLGFSGEIIHMDDGSIYANSGANLEPLSGPGDGVYAIYTSGTTGKSKGALIKHSNLVNYVEWFAGAANLTAADRTVLTSSFGFDLGYTAIFSSLSSGCRLHIIPEEIYLSPEELINYIEKKGISYLKMTPSLFSTVVESSLFSREKCGSLRLLVLGGEEIKPQDAAKAHGILNDLEVMNHYGPTEATIGCIAQYIDFDDFEAYARRPSIGFPINNTSVFILDKHLGPVPEGVAGDLYISGAGLIRGYLNRPELTNERFVCDGAPHQKFLSNFFQKVGRRRQKLYKTGDLARWLEDGRVEFLGRSDSQVKIRGFRIEIGEIESHLLRHPDVKEAVVLVKKNKTGDKYLCAYVVPEAAGAGGEESSLAAGLKEFLSRTLPGYMVPAVFAVLEKMPLTANGKLDRKRLPEPDSGGLAGEYTAPRDQVESMVCDLWSEVLGIEKIGIDDNFFSLGGHSLTAIMLTSKMHKAFSVRVTLAQIFRSPTVRGTAAYIKTQKGEQSYRFPGTRSVEAKDYYVLSSAQKRLYILQQFAETGTAYNTPRVLRLEGELDRQRLETTFRKLIYRHENLRTSFTVVDDEPVQRIHHPEKIEFKIEYSSADAQPMNIDSLVFPFDLSQAPLMRVVLVEISAGSFLFVLDMHHIISDGISIGLFLKDFLALYNGESLAPLKLQYKDFSEWQNGRRSSDIIKAQEAYWLETLAGEIPVLDLPTDFTRPAVQSFKGSRVSFELEAGETGVLKALALKENVTLYMVLFALFNIFLSRLSGQEDIIVGTPIEGRKHMDLAQVLGMFVNALSVRSFPTGGKRFEDFLGEIKEQIGAALENQEYQFEELVEKVAVTRDAGRNPLFDVVFLMQNLDIPVVEIPGLKLTPVEFESSVAKFDLTFICDLRSSSIGEVLCFEVEYCTDLFLAETIRRFIAYFRRIVTGITGNPELRIGEIEILSAAEKKRLLYDFNDTRGPYPHEKTIHELFAAQAAKTPYRIAITGPRLIPGRDEVREATAAEQVSLTYEQLNREADNLTRLLTAKGVKADTIIGLMVERSIEMIVGILAILKAGGAYLPIDPGYPRERKRYILKDSSARLLLTGGSLSRDAGEWDDPRVDILFFDELDKISPAGMGSASSGGVPHHSSCSVHRLAYVIYTSGSTGRPKGVLVEHSSVVNLLFSLHRLYPLQETDKFLFKTSYLFDVSVAELFGWYMAGGKLAILDAGDEKEPGKIIAAIEKSSVTHINFVPSMFNVFVDRLNPGNIKKLSSLKYIFLAGEALLPGLIERFRKLDTNIVLENIYGPTEAAVYASKYSLSNWDGRGNIPIGKPITNTNLYILDKSGFLLPIGVPGELCIGGAGLARGYLNRPELSAEKFVYNFLKTQKPYKSNETGIPGRIYRSGDLARWQPDGNIEFLGRIDAQVKIRGFRIELGEIESRLLVHEKIKEAVVMDRCDALGEKYLCAYIAAHSAGAEVQIAEFREYLSRTLPDYMIPAYFVMLSALPLTPNGKVDRKALPVPEIVSGREYAAPRNDIEEALVYTWSQVLGIEREKIGIDDNFFELGGHSLKATVMVAKLHRQLEIAVTLAEVFKTPTIRELARCIKKQAGTRYAAIRPGERKEYYPVSSAQKRLYLLGQMNLESTGYNIPSIFMLAGNVDKDRLQATFVKLIERHESLRTSFHLIAGEPVQAVHSPAEIDFKIAYLEGAAPEAHDFIRPFDLSQAPLLRVGLIKEGEANHILQLDMHHIISDGISNGLFVQDFMSLYNREELPPLKIQYRDFSHWQNKRKESEILQKQEDYWLEAFAGGIPVLDLPTDFPRPVVQSFAGKSLAFEISREETEKLKALALATGSTLYMVLLSLYNVFLSKLSGQEDIVVGSPVSGRTHEDMEQVIGVFINTLALRNYPAGEKSYREFLEELGKRTLAAFDNQEYQFEDLVEKAAVERDAGRNPLFDVLFVLQNMARSRVEIPGLELTPYKYEKTTSKFDLTFNVVELAAAERGLHFAVTYCSDLFKEETIKRFIGYFRAITAAASAHPEKQLKEIDILSKEERKRLLIDFNDTAAAYPHDKLLHGLFEEQVEKTRDRAALVGTGANTGSRPRELVLTYRKLNSRANQLARSLIEKGLEPGTPVGLMVERSIDMIVGILAVLKAGSPYLPIDPGYPAERIGYMIKDSRINMLLSSLEALSQLGIEFSGNVIDLGDKDLYKGDDSDPGIVMTSREPAYIIYTSGSTGRPKGVLVEHNPVVNLTWNQGGFFGITKHDRVLQFSSICFDPSVEQIFTTLTNGAVLVLIDKDTLMDSDRFVEFIVSRSITHLHAVPTFLNNIDLDIKSASRLKRIVSGGDVCPVSLAKKWSRYGEFYNKYGPTETTITSIEMKFDTVDDSLIRLPIGKPVNNTRVYLFDKWQKLVPVGVAGEMYIGGSGVAGGYLNNPELTAEKFVCAALPAANGLAAHSSQIITHHSPITLFRTGDLARWLADGTVEFISRLDDQVKIRGFRIEPGEIETRLLEHEGVKEAVVIDRQSEAGEKYLCAYVVGDGLSTFAVTGDQDAAAGKLREYLSTQLPDYMVPAFFIFLDSIPLNPNGKVDRKALPEPGMGDTGRKYTAPRNKQEELLVETWAEVLGIEKSIIGIDDNFFELGGHSLKASAVINKLHKKLDRRIPLAEIFKTPYIRNLARYIKGAAKFEYTSLEPVEQKSYYVLTSAQKRLYILQQVDPDGTVYNIPSFVPLGKLFQPGHEVDKEKLERTFRELIRRHESLRTSFHLIDEQPMQKIHDPREVPFEIENYGLPPGGFVRPFDLSFAPLLRVGMQETNKGKYLLMVDLHHIICDGISHEILQRDFKALYSGQQLAPLSIQYKDYSQWLHKPEQREVIEEQEAYWREIFSGEIPVLNLPTDFPRPAIQSFAGNNINFEIGEEHTKVLKALALKNNTSLFMLLSAIIYAWLAKISGQEDIVIGTVASGRKYVELDKVIGMFVGTLALRNCPAGEKIFREFLLEVKNSILGAFERQEYPFEELVEKVKVSRDASRNPLFDVMFVLQNFYDAPKAPGEGDSPREQGNVYEGEMPSSNTAKFDITLAAGDIGERILFTFQYCTDLFLEETVNRFTSYFKHIVTAVTGNPAIKIGEIEILSEEEKKQLLYDFNDTEVDYPQDKTITQLFEEQAARTPGNTAVWGSLTAQGRTGDRGPGFEMTGAAQSPGQETNKKLTYRQLNERANRLSRLLRDKGVKANSVVGIMLERSVELIEAIYAVLKAGGAYLPIDPEYPEKRILTMLEQGKAVVLLTRKELIEKKEIGDIVCPVLNLDELAGEIADLSGENLQPLSGPEDLIYIIFTSGSTGVPNGAGVYQRSFVNLINWFVKDFDLKAADRNLLMTSFSFDLTQKNFYTSLILGGVLCVPSINYFDPGEILRDIEERGVTWINCTPSMFFQLIEFCKEDELKKLSALRYVYLGGETLSMSMFMKWVESKYCNGVIVNTYGPTECTDISNAYRIAEPRRFLEEAVPIGKPVYNVKLYVTDKNLQLLPVGIAGELLIGGDSVGIGYVNDEELTKKKFVSHSFGKDEPEQMLYHTGDLVKWLPGGRIEFIGRIDFQVKIRGFRIEIGEIESRLLDYEKIKEIIVIDRDDGSGGKYLCAYFVCDSVDGESSPGAAELKEYLSDSLPDYMIPSYFVELAEMPLNPNGKVNRKALPVPETASGREYTAPRNKLEDMLVDTWSEILSVDRGEIGIDDNFFELGGHSLKAAVMISRLHKELDVSVPLAEIFRTPYIRKLARYIKGAAKYEYTSLEPVEQKNYYVLTSAQKRLYILQQVDPDGTVYNLTAFVSLDQPLQPGFEVDKEKLERTFRELIRRHESLRTSFHLMGEQPVQKVHAPREILFEIENYDLPAGGFVRPFDLSFAPLLRVGLQETKKGKYLLMVDLHHIICDGISHEILQRDFRALYSGERLAPLAIQYKDYSQWLNKPEQREVIREQETYWREVFSGEIPVLNLPTDFRRPAVQSFAGNNIDFEIAEEHTQALKTLALENKTSLFMLLSAIIYAWLAKISGREDIVIGTVTAGRKHVELDKVIGMFVGTLALRSRPAAEKIFREFLLEVKNSILGAFERQEYPFEELVEQVEVGRDAGRNPLFDVMFVLQNFYGAPKAPGEGDSPREVGSVYEGEMPSSNTAKFDITLGARDIGERILFTFQYCTDLFLEETVNRFVTYFKHIVTAVTGNPGLRIGEIEILSEAEKKRLLYDFNKAGGGYPVDKTIPQLFADQVRRTPENKALVYAGQELSYLELDEASGGITGYLLSRGAASGRLVGIMVNRSIEMITGILGILKTGSGYVPLNPKAPAERTRYILEECGVELLLSTTGLSEKVDELSGSGWLGETVFIDSPAEVRTGAEAQTQVEKKKRTGKSKHISQLFQVAYVIFTSGSTGKPKGVPITHANFCPLMFWGYEKLGIGPEDRAIQNLSYYFDWSVWEIFIALTSGASLYMVSDEVLLNPGLEVDFILDNKITVLHITPTQYQYLINVGEKLHTLKYLAIGAEKLTYDLTVRSFESVNEDCRVFNMYGPTEATIMAAVLEIDRRKVEEYKSLSSVPIGETIANTALLVLDKQKQFCPIGIEGELYIAGGALSHGYLNNPELTAEKFVSAAHPPFKNYVDHLSSITSHQSPPTLYRTGDRCRWLADGTVEFISRLDDQVKIRGFRIEPGEIENRLLEHEEVTEAVVIDRQSAAGEKYLCAYVVGDGLSTSPVSGDQDAAAGKLRMYLSAQLPDYMVPAFFIFLDSIPLNPNGKVDRKALPEPGIGNTGKKYTAPRNKEEELLAAAWADVLETGKSTIGIDDNFFELGGHSLKASVMIARLHKELNVKIPLSDLFRHPTIRELAALSRRTTKTAFQDIPCLEEREYYPLSYNQKRMYLLHELQPHSPAFNMPGVMKLEHEIDEILVEKVLARIIRRHESLRTAFKAAVSEIYQVVSKEMVTPFETFDLSGMDPAEKEQKIDRLFTRIASAPFDLARAPLFRAALIKVDAGCYRFIFCIHHIISDGWSLEI
ncbi:MAG: non-ribosomal peptide synthase/polyketide synthase, partial [Candidatus Aminicenantes bacterium]|nr:non-ribosomal peptide synthase/polyketide synthase [Candidatus Aminicenantes bacterium]